MAHKCLPSDIQFLLETTTFSITKIAGDQKINLEKSIRSIIAGNVANSSPLLRKVGGEQNRWMARLVKYFTAKVIIGHQCAHTLDDLGTTEI